MSRWHHAPCPKCSSSDAFSFKDDDEFGFCFSCNKSSPVNGDFYSPQTKTIDYNMHTMEEISVYDIRGFQERGITKTIAAHFGVHVSYSEDGSIHSHFYPYTDGGVIVAYKERKLPKEFVIHGNFKNIEMFGQAQVTGGKRLIITEGELDAMAVAQAQLTQYQKIYAVCAIPSASMVSKVLLAQRE
jgi:twinkle protein